MEDTNQLYRGILKMHNEILVQKIQYFSLIISIRLEGKELSIDLRNSLKTCPYWKMALITELSMSRGRMVATTSCRLLPMTDSADSPFLRMEVLTLFPALSWLDNLLMIRSR